MPAEKVEVAVLGAGVIGLSSAVAILDELSDVVNVTIIADKFNEETLSDGAAGIFRPHYFEGDKNGKWMVNSWKHFVNLSKSPDAAKAGVYLLPIYQFTNDKTKFDVNTTPYEKMSFGFRHLNEEELNAWPSKWKYGAFAVGCIAECRRYLPYLMEKFKRYRQKCERRHVYALEDLSDEFDLVINCSGFGARTLCSDHKVVPVRGQVMRVKAPWVKHAVYGDYSGNWDGYIIPGQDNVVCGGVRQHNKWSVEVDENDRADIWRKVTTLVPSLKDAPVEREFVGLRPYRDPIRVEYELMKFAGGRSAKKPLAVIHNYGHGGGGICLSWGCALEVTDILKSLLPSLPTAGSQRRTHKARL